MDSGYTRKKETGCERNRGVKHGSKMFGLSIQKAEETIDKDADDPKENRPGREGQKFNVDMLRLRGL